MDVPSTIVPERVLLVRFGVEPGRADLFLAMSHASGELRDREGPTDVLVDATCAGDIDAALDSEFLSWIVIHYDRVRRFAVVVDDLDACGPRLSKLGWVCGKELRVFPNEPAARDWLRALPWPDDVE